MQYPPELIQKVNALVSSKPPDKQESLRAFLLKSLYALWVINKMKED